MELQKRLSLQQKGWQIGSAAEFLGLSSEEASRIELALASEPALARDWERPQEDEAWSYLASLPSV